MKLGCPAGCPLDYHEQPCPDWVPDPFDSPYVYDPLDDPENP